MLPSRVHHPGPNSWRDHYARSCRKTILANRYLFWESRGAGGKKNGRKGVDTRFCKFPSYRLKGGTTSTGTPVRSRKTIASSTNSGAVTSRAGSSAIRLAASSSLVRRGLSGAKRAAFSCTRDHEREGIRRSNDEPGDGAPAWDAQMVEPSAAPPALAKRSAYDHDLSSSTNAASDEDAKDRIMADTCSVQG